MERLSFDSVAWMSGSTWASMWEKCTGRLTSAAVVAAFAASALVAVPVHADGINHFEAAAGPHNYVVTNHPAVLPHLTPSAWLILSYAHDPLVYRNAAGEERAKIVEHQINAEVAAALGLFNRFEVGVVAPAMWANGPGFNGSGLNELTPGNLRVLGKALLTPWNDGVVASVRLQSDLIPLAQLNTRAGALAGGKIPSVTPALSVGFNSQYFRLGVDVGGTLRVPTQIDTLTVGSTLRYGAGVEATLMPNVLFADLDVNGEWGPRFLGANRDSLPMEGQVALKTFFGPMVAMLGTGTGIVADYGAPDLRVFAAIGYYPRDDDKDDDGISDANDKCPDVPEDKDGFEDEDGCPDEDNDNDGVKDADDKCPGEAEDVDGWQDTDGCPEDDNDGDGIVDGDDECPNDPEVKNGFEDDDGCPDEDGKKKLVVVKREKIEINDKIFFAYDSDRILPRSYELLDNVAQVIGEHTEIPAIFVEGHTDSDGSEAYNLDLSDRRAKSVRRYLIDHGVAEERLQAKGFGEGKPIADNGTEDGKAQNRRVEFRIVPLEGGEQSEERTVPGDGRTAGPAVDRPSPAAPEPAEPAPPEAAPADDDVLTTKRAIPAPAAAADAVDAGPVDEELP